MDIKDFFPIETISKITQIPIGIIIPIIFFFGYITIRYVEKKTPQIKREMRTLDDIFLISLSGYIWFSRLLLFTVLVHGIIQEEDLIHDPFIVWLAIFYFLWILSTITDIETISQRKIFKSIKEPGKFRGIPYILLTIGAALFLSIGVLTDKSYESLIFFSFVFVSVTPSVYMLITFYKRIRG